MNPQDTKLGILGGGQLARMMLTPCMDWDLDVAVLDQQSSVCRPFCADFRQGDFSSPDQVIDLFKDRDVVTLDLEGVSLNGLKGLEEQGVKVAPSSQVIEIIQNKIKQKTFFKDHSIPTSKFEVLEKVTEETPHGFLKMPQGGYDGKGVHSFKGNLTDLPTSFQRNVLWEERVDVATEISVLVVRNAFGQMMSYNSTEMVFDPELNLIAYTLFPSRLDPEKEAQAQELARRVCEGLGCVGVLAVEMFLTKEGEILVNECAPRPHNSGHHTIETCVTSQFENHLRAVLGLPLGSCEQIRHGLTFNLIGVGEGKTIVHGLEELMAKPGVYFHLYGKKDCRVGRKMGHVTVTGRSESECLDLYNELYQKIKITGE